MVQRFMKWLDQHDLIAVFWYVFFGGLTTLVNIVVFGGLTHFSVSWQLANFFAWLLSVLFAFVTNKLWVFHSHTASFMALLWEFAKFIFARVVSLGIDYTCMFIAISGLHMSELWAKLVTQVVIVVANYVFSKVFIFKTDDQK